MMAAWTLGFWKAIATSGLAMILDITSSGVSLIDLEQQANNWGMNKQSYNKYVESQNIFCYMQKLEGMPVLLGRSVGSHHDI